MHRNDYTRLIKVCLISALWLTGALYSSYVLWRDLRQSGGAGDGAPVAHLQRRHADMRRRFASSYLWRDIETGEMIYHLDWIRGGGELSFNDGSTIELSDDGLVMIDDNADLTLKYAQGSLIVRTAQGDREIHVDSKGHRTERKIQLRVLEPASKAILYAVPDQSVHVKFSWQQKLDKPITFEFSTYENFLKAQRVSVKPGIQTLRTSLRPGKYYWRLVDGTEPLSEMRSFEVKDARPLTLVHPEASEKLELLDEKQKIAFRWLPPSDKDEGRAVTEIEVSQDSEFSSPVVKQKVLASTGLIRLDGFPPGSYFWRLVREYPDFTIKSALSEFSVVPIPKVTIVLENPSNGSTVEAKPEIMLQWKAKNDIPNDIPYEIEMTPPSGKIERASVYGVHYVLKNPPLGEFAWKVTATKQSRLVAESETSKFTLKKGAPDLLKPPSEAKPANGVVLLLDPTAQDPELVWEPVPQAKSYRVTVSGGAREISETTTEPKFPLKNIKDGKYHWTVRAIDSLDCLGEALTPREFIVKYGAPLPAPKVSGARTK